MNHKTLLQDKIKEALSSVLPIILIVGVLTFFAAPVTTDVMLAFLLGSVLLVLGLGIFMFGSENSMVAIGNQIGSSLTRSKKLSLILGVSLIIGIIITMAEPDLTVLASNVSHIDFYILIFTVSVGVGLFLLLCMVRILFGIPLRLLLLFFYGLIFILAFISDPDYISVAFDAGGVTTGPMTAPFIISLGIGVASIRSDKNAEADSFGLVALCSIGPIFSVLLLGFFYPGDKKEIAEGLLMHYENTMELGNTYLHAVPTYIREVFTSLLPIFVFFLIFQAFSLKLKKAQLEKILIGLTFTFIGLVIFLTGVNVGFSALGRALGEALVNDKKTYLTVPVFALIGWFVVLAEPAVRVLSKQVEEVSAGAVSQRSMLLSLSVSISLAMALSMIRALTGIGILWFVVPGYLIALVLMFFVPPIFTAIAFDSGGVASGPMSATFMLPFAMGVCRAVGGNVLTDAFGTVALVALMPLISVQIMGIVSVLNNKKKEIPVSERYSDTEIIELWD